MDTTTEPIAKLTYPDEQIVFYCKDCDNLSDTATRLDKRYIYKCNSCKSQNVAFGTYRSINTHFLKR